RYGHFHAVHPRSRRPRAQSQEYRCGHAARQPRGHHGAFRLGQILARLRHHLCRGPAPLCRKPLGLCAPVPGADAEARCRSDRRLVAGDLDRAEDHLEKSPLDRRHRDRDLRLFAFALCADRRPLLARHRPADRKPDRLANGRSRHGNARRHAASAAGADRARPQGRISQGSRRSAKARLPARQDRQQDVRDRRSACARQEAEARYRGGGRSLRGARRTRQPRRRFARDRVEARGWNRDCRERRWRRAHHLLGEIRLPGLGLHHPRDRAAAVLLQQSAWRLPCLRRARHQAVLRSRAGRRRRAQSLREGVIAPWAGSSSQYYQQTLDSIARHFKESTNTPWKDLPEKVRKTVLFGSGETPITMRYDDGQKSYTTTRPFEGVIPNMERRFKETDSAWLKEELGRYQNTTECEVCHGKRLKPEALAVKINKLDISQICDYSILEAGEWFAALGKHLTAKQRDIAQRILKEINERLGFLRNVGLEYLTLSRASGTLSGGESQRIRLASQIGSGLTGVLYVLDEPSIGLHQRDNDRLLATLKRLRDLGNTVIVVEH